MTPLILVYEDILSGEIMREILLQQFKDKFLISSDINKKGFGSIKKDISKFNKAAEHNTFFILTDLDLKECAVTLMQDWLNEPKSPNLIFRVAVREVESWLLADRKNLSNFFGISEANIIRTPEQLENPKQALINIAIKSRNRELREDIVPRSNSTAKQGPNYNNRLIEFVKKFWNVMEAAKNADSLSRTIYALDKLEAK